MKETIGQRILAAVISHQLGISVDRALKVYVRNCDIDPSWEAVGEELLKHAGEPAAPKVGRRDVGPVAGAAPE
jgi:hypothetical protein